MTDSRLDFADISKSLWNDAAQEFATIKHVSIAVVAGSSSWTFSLELGLGRYRLVQITSFGKWDNQCLTTVFVGSSPSLIRRTAIRLRLFPINIHSLKLHHHYRDLPDSWMQRILAFPSMSRFSCRRVFPDSFTPTINERILLMFAFFSDWVWRRFW